MNWGKTSSRIINRSKSAGERFEQQQTNDDKTAK